jgi:hypothetical protein
MRLTPRFLVLLTVGLAACGTVSETQTAAPAPQAESTAPVIAPEPTPVAQVAPAPAPARAPVAPAPKRAVKKKVVKAVAAVPAPAPVAAPAAPTDQEIAAALAYVDEALARYMVEQLRFTSPTGMKRDATGAATLEFGSAAAFDKARAAIAANEQVRRAGIQVSSRVQGRLTGENMEVKAGSPETQELSGALPGKWNWQLVPAAEGKAKLHLVLSVDTTVAGSAAPRTVHTLDKEILVEGAPAAEQGGFFSANWWWLLIVALVASVGAWFMRRRSA